MQEQDRDLAQWLASYRVADADDALLERIIAAASAEPQVVRRNFSLRFWLQGWAADAAALAAVALLGFWIGNTTQTTTAVSAVTAVVAQQTSSSGSVNIDQIVFGPKSWKEVSL